MHCYILNQRDELVVGADAPCAIITHYDLNVFPKAHVAINAAPFQISLLTL